MKEHIAEIIGTCRCGDENFFTDCTTAAERILDYLEKEAERAKVIPINVELNKCMVI